MENGGRGHVQYVILITVLGLVLCLSMINRNDVFLGNGENSFLSLLKLDMPLIQNESGSGAIQLSKDIKEELMKKVLALELPIFGQSKSENYEEKDSVKSNLTAFSMEVGEFKKGDVNKKYVTDSDVFNENLIIGDQRDIKVLIYHTHNQEGYKPGPPDANNEEYSIMSVGAALKEELEKYGITVIHDKTIHDDYNMAYTQSRATLEKNLQKYGEFDLIIDMHRDSGPSKERTTANINGEDIAKLMLVYAANNPDFEKNFGMGESITAISDSLYPSLMMEALATPNVFKNKAFNQDKSPNALLIEVGTELNTIEEARNTMKYLARVIAEYVN